MLDYNGPHQVGLQIFGVDGLLLRLYVSMHYQLLFQRFFRVNADRPQLDQEPIRIHRCPVVSPM